MPAVWARWGAFSARSCVRAMPSRYKGGIPLCQITNAAVHRFKLARDEVPFAKSCDSTSATFEASYRGVQRHTQTCGASTNNDQIELCSPRRPIRSARTVDKGVCCGHGGIASGMRIGIQIGVAAIPGSTREQGSNSSPAPELPAGSGAQRTLPSFHLQQLAVGNGLSLPAFRWPAWPMAPVCRSGHGLGSSFVERARSSHACARSRRAITWSISTASVSMVTLQGLGHRLGHILPTTTGPAWGSGTLVPVGVQATCAGLR